MGFFGVINPNSVDQIYCVSMKRRGTVWKAFIMHSTCSSDPVVLKETIVNLRKRPTSEIRGPQTVGVFWQHNTAHDISKSMSFLLNHRSLGILIGTVGATFQTGSVPFLLNHKSLGILIGNVGFVFQTGLDQFSNLLVPYRSNSLHCAATDRFTSIRGHWCGGVFS